MTPVDDRPVLVYADDEAVAQPETFKFCPLGVQFYTRKKYDECSIHEFSVDVEGDGRAPERISCSGVVVDCCKSGDGEMYRVWMKFLDLPETASDRIHCLVKSTEFLCPFCENY